MRRRGEGKKKGRSVGKSIYVRLQSKEYKNVRWKAKQKVSREEVDRKEDEMRKENKRKGKTVNRKIERKEDRRK